MNRDDFPTPRDGFVLTHFLTTKDVGRSRAFYADILGGKVLPRRGAHHHQAGQLLGLS